MLDATTSIIRAHFHRSVYTDHVTPPKLGGELADILALGAAHGPEALIAALERAVAYRRWRAGDVRSILAIGGHGPTPRPAGEVLAEVLTLPTVPTRSLDAYKIIQEPLW